MPTSLKSSNSARPSTGLSVVQKLDLYQIIAFAEEGDTKSVIARARQMLRGARVDYDPGRAEMLRKLDAQVIIALAWDQYRLTDDEDSAPVISDDMREIPGQGGEL